MGKGEIARYERFLLFPQCFQKTSNADTSKPGLVWERVRLRDSEMLLLKVFYISVPSRKVKRYNTLTDLINASLSLTPKYDMYSLVKDSILISHNNIFQVER